MSESAIKSPDHLRTVACFLVEEILPMLIEAQRKQHNKLRCKLITHDSKMYYPKVSSKRLQCLVKNLSCVKCGIKGEVFLLQLEKSGTGRPHYNLYAVENDALVLMTRDHIIPRVKGGPDTMENSQTMCYPCNQEKSDHVY